MPRKWSQFNCMTLSWWPRHEMISFTLHWNYITVLLITPIYLEIQITAPCWSVFSLNIRMLQSSGGSSGADSDEDIDIDTEFGNSPTPVSQLHESAQGTEEKTTSFDILRRDNNYIPTPIGSDIFAHSGPTMTTFLQGQIVFVQGRPVYVPFAKHYNSAELISRVSDSSSKSWLNFGSVNFDNVGMRACTDEKEGKGDNCSDLLRVFSRNSTQLWKSPHGYENSPVAAPKISQTIDGIGGQTEGVQTKCNQNRIEIQKDFNCRTTNATATDRSKSLVPTENMQGSSEIDAPLDLSSKNNKR